MRTRCSSKKRHTEWHILWSLNQIILFPRRRQKGVPVGPLQFRRAGEGPVPGPPRQSGTAGIMASGCNPATVKTYFMS